MDPQLKALIDSLNELTKTLKQEKEQAPLRDDARAQSEIERTIAVLEAELALEEDLNEQNKINIQLMEQAKRLNEITIKDKTKLAAKNSKLSNSIKKLTKQEEDHSAAINSVVENVTGFLGVSRSYEKSLFSQAKAVLTNKDAYEKLNKELKENLSTTKLLLAGVSKATQIFAATAVKSFSEFENGLVSFNRATGMTDMFGKSITSAALPFRQFGVESADVAQSLTVLAQSIPLSELGQSAASIAGQFALYEKFGISAQSSASAFENLTRSLGRSNEEAQYSISNIGELGRQLGMGAGALVEDFSQALPRLAIFGNQAEKIFRNIATASAKMGLGVDDILNLSEGLQTFEGSAQAAGRLNAILGGGFIDNLELMQASFEDPVKAARMVKSAFEDAGMSLETMGPAALKAAAGAAGFSDVNKFRKFLEGDATALESREDTQNKLQLKANRIAVKSQTLFQQIADNLQAFTNKFTQGAFESFTNAASGLISTLGPVGIGLSALLGVPALSVLAGKAVTGAAGLGARALNLAATKPPMPGQPGFIGPLQPSPSSAARFAGLGRFGGMALRGAGIAGSIAMVGKDAFDLASGDTSNENKGGVMGGLAGGVIGGALGSVIPVVGTAIGASLGAGLGNLLGNTIGKTFDSSMPKAETKVDTSTSGTTISQNVKEVKHVIEIVQNTPQAEQFVTAIYRKDLSSNAIG